MTRGAASRHSQLLQVIFLLKLIHHRRLCFLSRLPIYPSLMKSVIGSGTVPRAGGDGGLFGPLTDQA